MWLEYWDYTIRDTDNGKFQAEPSKYGKYWRPGENKKEIFETEQQAREWVRIQTIKKEAT